MGGIWRRAGEAARRALEAGALAPIPTRGEWLRDGDAAFWVRVIARLAEKPRPASGEDSARANPFLPYDPAMFVADLPPRHVGLLNKYNVLDRHMLIVTREYRSQEEALDEGDFEALWRCLLDGPSLGFYNAGAAAGASQRHKHLQAVAFPLTPGGPDPPLGPLIESCDAPAGAVGRSPQLPFPHAVAPLPGEPPADAGEAARRTIGLYRRLLRAVGCWRGERADPAPYNLLLTHRWMLVVPRRREHFHTVSINALGFAGLLLAKDEAELDLLRRCGPMRALREVAGG